MKPVRFLAIAAGVLLNVGLGFAQTGAAIAEREKGSARAVEFRRVIPSLPGTGAISGIAFEDTNGNGLLDSGERPFAGLMVLLNLDVPAPVFAPTLAITVSRVDGTFEFHDIPFGKYVVIVPDPNGYRSTSPDNPPRARVVLDDAHPNVSGLLFGKALAGGVISGTSFRDLDGSGSRDAGEPGVPGIRIELRLVTGQLVASTQTDSSGNFLFGRGLAGTYELTQVLPGGLAQTLPRGDGTTRVTLTSGPGVSGLLFGNQEKTGSISGTVFDDRNSSGTRDGGEVGLAGIAVSLQDPYGLLHRTVTDASGIFSFTSLPAGAFTVSATVPAGSLETAPPGSSSILVTLEDGGLAEGLLFGLYRPFSRDAAPTVSGSVFLDRNGNAVIDGLDRPLSGVPVVLTDSSGVSLTAVSSADGAFRFENLAPGNYVLSELVPAGFTQTFPGSPAGARFYSLTLSRGDQRDGLLFLNR